MLICTGVCRKRSEDSWEDSVLSSHSAGSRDQAQAIGVDSPQSAHFVDPKTDKSQSQVVQPGQVLNSVTSMLVPRLLISP